MKFYVRTRADFLRLAYARVAEATGEPLVLPAGFVERAWWLSAEMQFDKTQGRPVRRGTWEDNRRFATGFLSEADAWAAFDRTGVGGRGDYVTVSE